VGILLGPEKVGLYRIATHLTNVINPLRQAAYSYLPARGSSTYASFGKAGLKKWVKRTALILCLGLTPLCGFLIIFPNQVLAIVYGQHVTVAGLGIILALSTVAQFIITAKFPLDIAIMTTGNTRLIFYLNILPVVLLLTVGVTLIYHWGILGVPIAGLIMNGSLLITTYLAYQKIMKEKS
jgi:O-antigen/teichoic acid export membrane protein